MDKDLPGVEVILVRNRDEHTSLLIQLLQHFSDDLADALQRLDVLFRDIELSLQILDPHAKRLELGFPFSELEQAPLVILERLLSLRIAGAVHDVRQSGRPKSKAKSKRDPRGLRKTG